MASNGSDEGTTIYPASCTMHADMVMPRNALALLYGDNHVCYHVFQNPTPLSCWNNCRWWLAISLRFLLLKSFSHFGMVQWEMVWETDLLSIQQLKIAGDSQGVSTAATSLCKWNGFQHYVSWLKQKDPLIIGHFCGSKLDQFWFTLQKNTCKCGENTSRVHHKVDEVGGLVTKTHCQKDADIYEHRCKIDYWFGESLVLDRAVKQSPYTEEHVSTDAQDSHGVSPADWWNGETIWKAEDWPKWRHGGMDV